MGGGGGGRRPRAPPPPPPPPPPQEKRELPITTYHIDDLGREEALEEGGGVGQERQDQRVLVGLHGVHNLVVVEEEAVCVYVCVYACVGEGKEVRGGVRKRKIRVCSCVCMAYTIFWWW